ncbi:TPA: cobalamin-binding protein [bacterium]|jgi:5-methyltetrahydrofolate--homocysteine methyltransferase|nr:cobalamin-binding protein [bacterium]
MADLSALAESIINGKAKDAKELVQKALDDKVPVSEILNNGLVKGMSVVGEKFKNNEFYVPEVLIAARAMHSGMELLKPLLASSGVEPIGKVAIGTVKGDLHDIGKNLVVMMLEGAGFEVMDLGIDVPPEKFVEAAKQGAQVIAMSALLTTTMTAMKTTIDALKEAGVRDGVKTLIGGAPVTKNYADEIGADGYARDAASGADEAKKLIGK